MLEGKTITLRALEPTDVNLLYLWENDTKIWHVSNTQMPYSKDYLTKYINAVSDIYTDKQLRLVIVANEKKLPIGFVDLYEVDFNHQRAGIGILIASEKHRKKGFADAALKLVLHYSFTILNLNQLFCNILISNKASLHLFEKNKFILIGAKKNWIRTSVGFEDELMLQHMREKQ